MHHFNSDVAATYSPFISWKMQQIFSPIIPTIPYHLRLKEKRPTPRSDHFLSWHWTEHFLPRSHSIFDYPGGKSVETIICTLPKVSSTPTSTPQFLLHPQRYGSPTDNAATFKRMSKRKLWILLFGCTRSRSSSVTKGEHRDDYCVHVLLCSVQFSAATHEIIPSPYVV